VPLAHHFFVFLDGYLNYLKKINVLVGLTLSIQGFFDRLVGKCSYEETSVGMTSTFCPVGFAGVLVFPVVGKAGENYTPDPFFLPV
jgi:hypothetical protein